MRDREIVTSPGRAGSDATRPVGPAPLRWHIEERFDSDTTAILRRVDARVRMVLESRRHDARAPHTRREDGITH